MSVKISQPEEQFSGESQYDHNPAVVSELTCGREGVENCTRTAIDIKDMHQYLSDFTNDELRKLGLLDVGSRLEPAATYINLARDRSSEFQATGNEEVGRYDLYVAKHDTHFELWNRLLQFEEPEWTMRKPK